MDAKLVIVGGKANKSQVSVKLPTVIGRSREADLTVAHPMISRKHCELYEVDGLVRIRDLGSLNGLFVGSRQVNEAALHPNAEFTVGPLTFRIDYEYEHRDQGAPPPDASTLDDTVEQPEDESPGKIGKSEVAGELLEADPPQGFTGGEEPLSPEEEAAPGPSLGSTEAQPAVAPPNGGMPDFSAWEERTGKEGDDEQAGEPSLPAPPPSFGEVSGQEEADFEIDGEAEPDSPAASLGNEMTPETISLPESDPADSEPEEPADDALNEFLKGFE